MGQPLASKAREVGETSMDEIGSHGGRWMVEPGIDDEELAWILYLGCLHGEKAVP